MIDLSPVLYAAEYVNDTLFIYLISVETGAVFLISSEAVGAGAGSEADGLAWNPETNMFFFTTYPQSELWNQELDDLTPSSLGNLFGDAASGTFHDGYYYYVDDVTNSIVQVSFDEDFQYVSSIDATYLSLDNSGLEEIESIAFSPDGTFIYVVGVGADGTRVIMRYDVTAGEFDDQPFFVLTDLDLQIAVGADGNIYGVDGFGGLFGIDSETGTIEPLFELAMEFNNLSGGPLEEGSDTSAGETQGEE